MSDSFHRENRITKLFKCLNNSTTFRLSAVKNSYQDASIGLSSLITRNMYSKQVKSLHSKLAIRILKPVDDNNKNEKINKFYELSNNV